MDNAMIFARLPSHTLAILVSKRCLPFGFGLVLCILHLPCHAQSNPTGGPIRTVSSGADIVPKSTVAYLEIRQPKALLNTILQHPLRGNVEKFSIVKQISRKSRSKMSRFYLG